MAHPHPYRASSRSLQYAIDRLNKAVTPAPAIGKVTRGLDLWSFECGEVEYKVDDYGKVIKGTKNSWRDNSWETLLEAYEAYE